jgi:hypothetical protein
MAAFASIESSIILVSMFLSPLLIIAFYFLSVFLFFVVCSKMEAQTQAQAHKPSGIRWNCYTKSI